MRANRVKQALAEGGIAPGTMVFEFATSGIARIIASSGADFVIFDPQGRFAIAPEMIQHRHKVTPYAGEEMRGVVKTTWLRGRKVWEDEKPIGNPAGQWIRR